MKFGSWVVREEDEAVCKRLGSETGKPRDNVRA